MLYSILRISMKKLLLLFGFLCLASFSQATADTKNDELQRKSELSDQVSDPTNQTTYPAPFNADQANPVNSPAISTGYYFVDSRENSVPDYWRPNIEIVDLDEEPLLWRRILSGPRQQDSTYWALNPGEGMRFFRNPAVPTSGASYFKHGLEYSTDSTNNAIAGPIPLGINRGFFFNGIRYDSFYVSTNGVIALTNRRYFYDADGNVQIPAGSETAYDPMSMDWFAAGRGRTDLGTEETRLPDNFGYQYAVLGGETATMNQTGGIRANGPGAAGMAGYQPANKAALIAPFWGPLAFRQYNPYNAEPEDFSQVWFKRSNAADKLIIYYINVQPEGGTRALTPMQTTYAAPTNAVLTQDANYVDASCQVVLDRIDSSITFQYERMRGGVIAASKANLTGSQAMQAMTCAGVRGFARHVNFDGTNGTYPWANEYEQYTHFNNAADPRRAAIYSNGPVAVKFKQHKNNLRVYDVKYMVRTQDANANNDFNVEIPSDQVKDYELLAGEEKIGAVQAVVTVQNLTNEIQGTTGVNYVPQDLNFQVRMRIKNDASDETVFTAIVPVNDSTLSLQIPNATEKVRYYDPFNAEELTYTEDMNGIPPYGFAQITFRPFEPSEIESKHHGRLTITIFADTIDPVSKLHSGEKWPFDNTSEVRLWVMTRLTTFKDDVTEFHAINGNPVPSVLKWVNLGAEAIDGDNYSLYPLAPRGQYQDVKEKGVYLNSPALLLDRMTEEGGDWDADQNPLTPEGDQLRSFPINLSGKVNPVLTLSVQRSIQSESTNRDRGFCDAQLLGPEPRSVILATEGVFNPLAGGTVVAASKWYDELRVEFAYPSPDGIQQITNIEEDNWRKHDKQTAPGQIAGVSAYTLYGGGGHCLGFLEGITDSALTVTQGIRFDRYDDGFDFDYKKIFIPIPSYILNASNNGARNFRFRLHVVAYNHFNAALASNFQNVITDDRDPFIVDNVAVISQQEEADVEISSVKIKWPYTAIPASQATNVPVSVIVSNNSSLDAKPFVIRTFITKNDGRDTVYCRYKSAPVLRAGTTYTVDMPGWNARTNGPGLYRLHSQLHYVGNAVDGIDIDTTNDYNYHDVTMVFSDVYSYEKATSSANATNQVSGTIGANMSGRGLRLPGWNFGGYGKYVAAGQCLMATYFDEVINGCGGATEGAGRSGQIAVKFNVLTADTIYGFQAFFTDANVNTDNIYLSVYNNQGSNPGTQIQGSQIERVRGRDDVTGQTGYNKYVTYLLDNPILLQSGTYWIAIGQRNSMGIDLGGRADRMGMRTIGVSIPAPINTGGPIGGAGTNLLVDKDLRTVSNTVLINDNLFAYENTIGSGAWNRFMNTTGNPGYAHLDHYGLSPEDGVTYTLTRGTWLPMFRPYFGTRSVGTANPTVTCPPATADDLDPVPVEFYSFDGHARNNGIEIYWATASELNNKGFYVEKAQVNDEVVTEYESIAFVEGIGNSTVEHQYSHFDKDVVSGTTYRYRLRQVDNDGSECDVYSNEIEIEYNHNGDVVLEANYPNPVTSSTEIAFVLNETANVQLEVLDMYGNVVKTLANGTYTAQRHTIAWDATNSNGASVASGSYIYRLNVNGQIFNGKMSVVR